MWTQVKSAVGLLELLDRKIADRETLGAFEIPSFAASDSIVMASDYSGERGPDPWTCLSFILLPGRSHREWELRRTGLRQSRSLKQRRMAFAKLNDDIKRAALPAFLRAVGECPGLLVSVLISRQVASLLEPDGIVSAEKWGAPLCVSWQPEVLEKMLRITHIGAFFCAGVASSGQVITWVTDEDAMAPNPARFSEMTDTFRTILGYYLGDRSLAMLRCFTTAAPNGARNLEAEDLAAIPDLVGGALVELFSELANKRSEASESLAVPDPEALSSKTRQKLAWLRGTKRLSHLVYTVRSAGSGQIEVTDVDMGEPLVQLAR